MHWFCKPSCTLRDAAPMPSIKGHGVSVQDAHPSPQQSKVLLIWLELSMFLALCVGRGVMTRFINT